MISPPFNPLFSILLPTKGRAGYWPYALRSLLMQSETNFEVIFIDNDDGTDTAVAYHHFVSELDYRFRYIRTGGLNMSDNWEHGLAHARGQYVYVMEDKAVLYPHALQFLHSQIASIKPDVLVFLQASHAANPVKLSVDTVLPTLNFRVGSFPNAAVHAINSDYLCHVFLNDGWNGIHDYGPRAINSVCKKDVIDNARSVFGRFFNTICPDFTSLLATLDCVDVVHHAPIPLVSFCMKIETSGGWKARSSIPAGFDVLYSWGREAISHMAAMPLGYLPLLHNYLYADFMKMAAMARGNLRGKSVSTRAYFSRIRDDLSELALFGNDIRRLAALLAAVEARYKGVEYLQTPSLVQLGTSTNPS